MFNIFVYDDMLLTRTRELLKLNPVNEVIAEATGKLYMMHRLPVMLKLNDVSINKGTRRVLGAILTFDDADLKKVIFTLDNYKANSISRLGIPSPHDFTKRETIQAYPLIYKSIDDILEYKYGFKRPVECIAYLGNPENPVIIYNIKINRHRKLFDGVYKKGFKELLMRGGLLNEWNSTSYNWK